MLSPLARRTTLLVQRRALATLLHAPTPTQAPRHRMSSTKTPNESNLHQSDVKAKADDKDVPLIPPEITRHVEANLALLRWKYGPNFERLRARNSLDTNPAAASSSSTIPEEAPRTGAFTSKPTRHSPSEPLKKQE